MDWFLVRAIILCSMFAVLTYQDIRTRTTDDKVLIVFGGAGAAIYLFDHETFDMLIVGMIMIGSVLAGFLAWKFAIGFGSGDILALITASIIFPLVKVSDLLPLATSEIYTLQQSIPIIFMLFMGATLLAGVFVISVNVMYNLSDLMRGKLFAGVRDGYLRKTVAFMIIHRQRNKPRYVFVAQKKMDDGMHINLKQTDINADWAPRIGVGKTYVSFPPPFMPFLFIMMFIPLLVSL